MKDGQLDIFVANWVCSWDKRLGNSEEYRRVVSVKMTREEAAELMEVLIYSSDVKNPVLYELPVSTYGVP